MGWENKVVWSEGLFLQPQHLQQQERYFDRLVRGSTAGLRPFGWGLTQLDIDTDLLALGKFAVRAIAGILPDGTPFSAPADVDCPTPARPAREACTQQPSSICCCRRASPAAWRPRRPSAGDRGALRHRRA